MILRIKLFLIISIFFVSGTVAQDILLLNNGDKLHGEIKKLDQSVLTMETPYSDSDFKIEWEKVIQIVSPRHFLIFLKPCDFCLRAVVFLEEDLILDLFVKHKNSCT